MAAFCCIKCNRTKPTGITPQCLILNSNSSRGTVPPETGASVNHCCMWRTKKPLHKKRHMLLYLLTQLFNFFQGEACDLGNQLIIHTLCNHAASYFLFT
ncbi:hypothetical protein PRIO_4919 [Paenibacillus riograndensis SBR5]|uniref:Uncharacterized protein n=1 Tax=Paenibacillus riograndensis SBR5 TaxID=1073571 RepID=A0A0E4HDH7_9BACL|nr:hypothetical protein PRIO_4919 [Paenibacillus riograndensis SBR5]